MALYGNDYRIIADGFGNPVSARPAKSKRIVLFMLIFVPLVLALLSYVFLQPAVYQSKATVLTMAPASIQQTEIGQPNAGQHKPFLLGQALLEQTAERLNTKKGDLSWTVDQLRAIFKVNPIPDTNLLQLMAEGANPNALQTALNAWIDTYVKSRAQYLEEHTQKTIEQIAEQTDLVNRQVADKRKEIERFRLQYNIVSADNADNPIQARLQGLNESLNRALDDELKAKTKLDSVRNALSQGKQVVPESETQALAALSQQAVDLRDRLKRIQDQYTSEYIQLNPGLRQVKEQLVNVEKAIDEQTRSGASVALQEAENHYAAAHQTVLATQRQLAEHKLQAAEYTSQFSRLQSMQQELEQLESKRQEAEQRRANIEAGQRQNYPQVDVVDWASLPEKPIRPDYALQALFAFAGALLIALFGVWTIDFLSRDPTGERSGSITLAGIHLHPNSPNAFVKQGVVQQGVSRDPIKNLEKNTLRELSATEVVTLFTNADQQTREIISLLLNGLSVTEIVSLTVDCFNLEEQHIQIPLSKRFVVMTQCSAEIFAEHCLQARWRQQTLNAAEIDALLQCAAIDSGFPKPRQFSAEALRYTYTLFLIRQGVKLAELRKIIGPVAPSRLLELARFSPEHAGLPLDRVILDYL